MRGKWYFLLFWEFENHITTYEFTNRFLKYGAHCKMPIDEIESKGSKYFEL